MALYANVVNLPYVEAGMSDTRQQPTNPLLINVPSFEFSTSEFVNNYLFETEVAAGNDDARKDSFVKKLNDRVKYSLWSTIDMIKKWPYSRDECTVYTHFKKRFGDLTHTGPWPLMEGDNIHALPPLEVRELIDRRNSYVTNYKIHKNDTTIYTHPMIVSDTMFSEFFREVLIIKALTESYEDCPAPESALGRILGVERMKMIKFPAIFRHTKPIALVVHKNGLSGYDNRVCVGDSMTVEWLNR